ncbi:ATP-grasp domain-containing protein [Methanoregula sp.]|uniref:ATP-grasp domain-containing protein n=1 Tax=Methanoregula sp. TaxID=2052170 RepID=UPI002D0C8DA6|nr:ATP-grasp domain-containing protein [Methanoregula sp.]HVP96060.1 ATP-grasp domain-containing protein [Methanoregula sp.]
MKGRVLVAGFATRHVAQSAARAGYEVCAVDHFCDQDLAWYTRDRIRFEDLAGLPDAIARMGERYSFDFAIASSGAESLTFPVPLCGTPRERVERFLDKLAMQRFFENLGVPVPRIARDGEYPVMAKPVRGAGGWRNAVIPDAVTEKAWAALYPDVPYIRQEIAGGIPASVCCIANGTAARAVAINEQILRGSGEAAFGFSGSITPFDHPMGVTMTVFAEKIAAASGCTGTVGIDFVVSSTTPVVIEVNPRFQGTLDTVEAAYGYNLFSYHVNACAGTLPDTSCPQQYAARRILFADRDMTLEADLSPLAPAVSDIPWPGTFFEEEQAIVSVAGTGPTRAAALDALDKNISTVRQYMR